LNRHLRRLRPPRERPPHGEVPRHENYWQGRYALEQFADRCADLEKAKCGKIQTPTIFKQLDSDGDGYISLSDMKTAFERFGIYHTTADLHACFTCLDKADKGSISLGEFGRHYEVFQGNMLDAMARPIKGVLEDGGVTHGGPVQERLDAKDQEMAASQGDASARVKTCRAASAPATRPLSAEHTIAPGNALRARASTPSVVDAYRPMLKAGNARISDIMHARINQWKPAKSELYTTPAATRFGMNVYADTSHVVEPSVPCNPSYISDAERFTTTNGAYNILGAPHIIDPQSMDAVRKHSHNEFRVERIRARQRDFTERCWAANMAAQEFDEQKLARKALNQLNYERRCKMARA